MDIHISFQPEIIGVIFGMPIYNSLLLSVITTFLLVVGGFFIVRSLKLVPEKAQSAVELIVEGILDFMNQILQNK